MNKFKLSVKELGINEIPTLVKYWTENDDESLVKMGVDLAKLPSLEGLTQFLTQQVNTPIEKRFSYGLIWQIDGRSVGHSNVNKIIFGKEAFMHLHLWQSPNRQKGIGTQLVMLSLPYFFEKLQLEVLYCEPYALNPAPNKTLEKVGFEFVKRHTTIPGSINFEQEVNRWQLTREKYLRIIDG